MGVRIKSLKITEKQFMAQVVQYAKLRGWLVFHVYDSRRSVKGFPDLVLVREGTTLFVELKTDTGKVTPEQQIWLSALRHAGQVAAVWRPGGWAAIEILLQ